MRARCSTSAVDLGIVKKSGAWYTYEGEQLGQGRENAKTFLIENPEIMVEISERIRTAGRHRPDRRRPSTTHAGSTIEPHRRRLTVGRRPAASLGWPTRSPGTRVARTAAGGRTGPAGAVAVGAMRR